MGSSYPIPVYLAQVTIEAQVVEEDVDTRVPTIELAHLDQLRHELVRRRQNDFSSYLDISFSDVNELQTDICQTCPMKPSESEKEKLLNKPNELCVFIKLF